MEGSPSATRILVIGVEEIIYLPTVSVSCVGIFGAKSLHLLCRLFCLRFATCTGASPLCTCLVVVMFRVVSPVLVIMDSGTPIRCDGHPLRRFHRQKVPHFHSTRSRVVYVGCLNSVRSNLFWPLPSTPCSWLWPLPPPLLSCPGHRFGSGVTTNVPASSY